MLRRITVFLISLSMFGVPAAQAGDAMKDALGTLPGDAMALVIVPNLAQFDANYKRAIEELGFQPLIQPPMDSLVGMVKGNMPMLEGMDPSGPIALVVMPAMNMMELQSKAALVIPCGDPKGMLEALGAQPGENDVWMVNLFGPPMAAIASEKRIIVAVSPDVAKQIHENKTSLASKLKASDLQSLEGLHFAVWIDAERAIKVFRPQIDAGIAMLAMMQGAGGPMGMQQAEATKKQLGMVVDGMSTLSFGLSLDKPGLDMRFAMSVKADSELAKQTKVRATTESLLKGLPGDPFMISFGQHLHPGQMDAGMQGLDPLFAMLEGVESVDKAKVGELKELVTKWLPMITGARGMVQAGPGGSDGQIALGLVVETTDSKAWLSMADKAFSLTKELVTQVMGSEADEDALKVLAALTHKSGVETIDGASVNHLRFDIDPFSDDMSVNDRKKLDAVIGKDGVLFRLAPADDKAVVMSFGGGKAYAGKIIASAKGRKALLDELAGIKKVSAQLPKERYAVVYVAVDEILATINRIAVALGEDELPVNFGQVDAPVTVQMTGGDAWSRGDLFIPSDLMKAGAQAAMAAMAAEAAEAEHEMPDDTPVEDDEE